MGLVGFVIDTVLVLLSHVPKLHINFECYTALAQALPQQGIQNIMQLRIEQIDRIIEDSAA